MVPVCSVSLPLFPCQCPPVPFVCGGAGKGEEALARLRLDARLLPARSSPRRLDAMGAKTPLMKLLVLPLGLVTGDLCGGLSGRDCLTSVAWVLTGRPVPETL